MAAKPTEKENEFPAECSGCKKKLGGGEYSEYYSVYQCRKDHWIVCCKVDCQRLLDKRCSKVSEQLRKMQHKLNNDGHTSALRRLPPGEREKLKQYAEAENNNLLICPIEGKAVDRSVPYCAYAMHWIGGYGKRTTDKDDDSAEILTIPLPGSEGGLMTQADLKDDGLVDDINLVELKRDEDQDPDETPSSKQKKGSKNKSQKKPKNVIQIDFRTPGMGGEEVYPETLTTTPTQSGSRPAAWFQNPATRNINGTAVSQAWNVKAGNAMEVGAITAQRPPDFASLLSKLMNTVGCSESKATELLEQNQYRLESAADAYFSQETGMDAVDNRPRWGPRGGTASRITQMQPSQVSQTDEDSTGRQAPQEEDEEEEETSGLQPPAPSQPPPPRLPPEWQALWNEQQHAYYFWHVPTNHTTWDAPIIDDESAEEQEAAAVAAAKAAEEARQKAEEDGRNVMVKKVSDVTGLSAPQARALLESHGWGVEQAIKSHKEVEQRRARELEEERRAAEAKRAEEQVRKRAEEEATRERHKKSERGDSKSERLPAQFIISQNWRPRDEGCIRLTKGEVVIVKWMDDSVNGWVYGHLLHDEQTIGYFPRAVLQKVRRKPRQYDTGEVCGIRDFFQGPEEVRGYLNVAPGDLIKVLHPLDEPFVWAYVEVVKSEVAGCDERGWVPESILCDQAEASNERCPHPAG